MEASMQSSSSPPRCAKKKKKSKSGGNCIGMFARTLHLVTSREVIPFYLLAIGYSFYYAPNTVETGPHPPDLIAVRVLPLLYLVLLVVLHPSQRKCPLHDQARGYIIGGLLLNDIACLLMALDEQMLIFSLVFSALSYIFYTVAFYQYYTGSSYGKLDILFTVVVAAILAYLVEDLNEVAIILLIGMIHLFLGFFAASRLENCLTGSAYVGWAGVKLLLFFDIMMTANFLIDSLDNPVPRALVAMTYFLGHLGVALSTYTIGNTPSKADCTPKSEASGAEVSDSKED